MPSLNDMSVFLKLVSSYNVALGNVFLQMHRGCHLIKMIRGISFYDNFKGYVFKRSCPGKMSEYNDALGECLYTDSQGNVLYDDAIRESLI